MHQTPPEHFHPAHGQAGALLKTRLFLEELLNQPEEPEQQHLVCF